jgi:hypothetical protein
MLKISFNTLDNSSNDILNKGINKFTKRYISIPKKVNQDHASSHFKNSSSVGFNSDYFFGSH